MGAEFRSTIWACIVRNSITEEVGKVVGRVKYSAVYVLVQNNYYMSFRVGLLGSLFLSLSLKFQFGLHLVFPLKYDPNVPVKFM